jgi:hypothetical protein
MIENLKIYRLTYKTFIFCLLYGNKKSIILNLVFLGFWYLLAISSYTSPSIKFKPIPNGLIFYSCTNFTIRNPKIKQKK